jgi:peptidyl-prolyl cis-trans isomerase C
MDNMIQELLLAQAASQAGIGVDPAAVDAAVAAQVAPPSLDAAPILSDTTALRVSAAREQLVLEMIARNTRADMFRSRHILVADEATADKVLAELAAGKPFAELARQYSTDTASVEQGGDLGWVPRGDFVQEYEEAAFSVALNTPTKVQSQFGWHVLVIDEREESRPFESFAQLQASQSGQSYFEQSFTPWYNELRSAAEASGDLQISPNFDPNSVPLPFPE